MMSEPVDSNRSNWVVLKDCLLYWQEHWEGLSTTSDGRCTMLLVRFLSTNKANISGESILESEVCKFFSDRGGKNKHEKSFLLSARIEFEGMRSKPNYLKINFYLTGDVSK